jgi:hypothetical protein
MGPLLSDGAVRQRRSIVGASHLIALLVGMACAGAGDRGSTVGWVGTVDTVADSVVVWTTSRPGGPWPAPLDAGPIELVWDDDRLWRPSVVTGTPSGDTLLVADRTEAFVLAAHGALLAVLGRAGEGPGEFRSIQGISPPEGDSVLLWDGGSSRLTWMRLDGSVIRTRRVQPPGAFRAPRPITLHNLPHGVVLAWSFGLVRADGVADTVVLALATPDAERVMRVGGIQDLTWMRATGVLSPKYPFGPRALYAVSSTGRVAVTDGVEYCIVVVALVERRPPHRICRDWPRQPVGPAAAPPPGLNDNAVGRIGPILRDAVAAQEPGELKNAIDEIRFDTSGRLWVRAVDSTHLVHPAYASRLPALRPPSYTWEVFSLDGRLIGRVRIPSAFRPQWITERAAYGLVDAEDGTAGVGRIGLPALR